jgi:hypothetical protein
MMAIRNTITGCRPLHIHCNAMSTPGCRHGRAFFHELLGRLDEFSAPPPSPSGELDVISFSTWEAPTPLEKSLAGYGVAPAIYGLGLASWRHRYKIDFALEHCRLSAASHILISDAADAVVVGHPAEILSRFTRMGVPALMALERNSYPDWPRVAQIEARRNPGVYRYGNAGGLIGSREFLCRMLVLARDLPLRVLPDDDQGRMRIAALALGAAGDHRCRIFQTLYGMNAGDLVVEQGDATRPDVEAETRPYTSAVFGPIWAGTDVEALVPAGCERRVRRAVRGRDEG